MTKSRARRSISNSCCSGTGTNDNSSDIDETSCKCSTRSGEMNINTKVEKQKLLRDWAAHQHNTFHNFDPDEAQEIRLCLLDWYRSNRRKLPWRGDAGPFVRSSSESSNDSSSLSSKNGRRSSKKRNKIKQEEEEEELMKGQKSITSFFKCGDDRNNTKRIKSETKEEGVPAVSSCCSSRFTATHATSMNPETTKHQNEHDIIPITGYSVWVSEIMLQQTRVEAVIPYYLKWMKSFPTVHDLANATEDEVNAHWAGLGFYRRARMLHQGAKYVSNDLNGTMPQSVNELMKINGIGRYTASAIASIAFNTCVPVVDGNVARVLSRLKGIANHIKAPILKDGLGWDLAHQIVTAGDGLYAGEVNQALMELGATYCAPSGTGIDENDPLKRFYYSTKIGEEIQELICHVQGETSKDKDPIEIINEFVSDVSYVRASGGCGEDKGQCSLCDLDSISSIMYNIASEIQYNHSKEDAAKVGHANFPTPPPKKNKREEVLAIAALSIDGEGKDGTKWLMVKRPKNGLLAGQWEFPSQCIWSSADEQNGSKSKAKGKKEISLPTFTLKSRRKLILQMLENYTFATNPDQDIKESPMTAAQIWQLKSYCTVRVVNRQNPIEHVFSHVRHSMWIEHCSIKSDYLNTMDNHVSFLDSTFHLGDGRKYKWLTVNDMRKIGITSAITKILKELRS